MNRLALVLFLLVFGARISAAEKKHYVLYGELTANVPVQLADGARWMMDKGDTFPIVMFKEQQTRVVLQLAGTTFSTLTINVKIIEEKDVTLDQLITYRTNVQHYLDARASKWKNDQAK